MNKLVTCLAVLLLCHPRMTVAYDSGRPANLLSNPSFEEKADSGASGWKSRAWSGEKNARWSVGSPGRNGKRCVSIRSERGADAAWSTTVTVKPYT